MKRLRGGAAFIILCAAAACETEPRGERAVRPAAEEAPAAALPELQGYDPDSLTWFREGRPVVFDGREWRPVGRPLPAPTDALRRVGEFEGMALFAAEEDAPPFDTLFFPLGNELWQPLEPVDPVISERSP